MSYLEIKINGQIVAVCLEAEKQRTMSIIRDTLNAAFQGKRIPPVVVSKKGQ